MPTRMMIGLPMLDVASILEKLGSPRISQINSACTETLCALSTFVEQYAVGSLRVEDVDGMNPNASLILRHLCAPLGGTVMMRS